MLGGSGRSTRGPNFEGLSHLAQRVVWGFPPPQGGRERLIALRARRVALRLAPRRLRTRLRKARDPTVNFVGGQRALDVDVGPQIQEGSPCVEIALVRGRAEDDHAVAVED